MDDRVHATMDAMVRKIMVGYRRDRHGEDALALGRLLATAAPVEDVLVVEALRESGSPRSGRTQRAEGRLATTTQGWPQGVRVTVRATPGASASDTLSSLAEAESVDLLVLGSTHRGFAGRAFIGTTAGSVLKHSTCAVSIAPVHLSAAPAALRRIGVAVDGSDASRAVLGWAADLASSCSASLQLIGVAEPPPPPIETWADGVPAEAWATGLTYADNAEVAGILRDRVRRDVLAAAASVGRGEEDTLTVVGNTAEELRDAAADLDMLVIGSHGRGRLAGAVLASVSRALAHSCPAPLAVVPLGADRAPGVPQPSTAS